MKSVKTYLSFSKKIDPASIVTMADLEISTALSSPLVEFNSERQVVSALAERWTVLPPNQMKFILRSGLKWSDGKPVTAEEYKTALERAKKLHGGDLKALFDMVEKIEATDERTLTFTTKQDVVKSGLLLKLTEPMYGLLAVKGGNLDLSKSAGPYVLKEEWEDELVFTANPNWYSHTREMPQTVEIRRPKDGQGSVFTFEKDDWANLISTSSLMSSETRNHLTALGYKTWQRSLDKVYGLFASKRLLKAGGAPLLKTLSTRLDRQSLMKGISGFSDAEQFFPRGYVLYSSEQPKIEPAKWTGKGPVQLTMFSSPTLESMNNDLTQQLSKLAGTKANLDLPPITKLDEITKEGNFDILALSFAVADPSFEGAMSFFIERDPPMIQSMPGEFDFAAQLRQARALSTSEERANSMRKIIIAAQEAGHFVPLFHFSSLAIGKPGIDLSLIPNSDEVVPFSKVRFK